MVTKDQKIRRCRYMKEIFDDCSERQLKKLRKILMRVEAMEKRILAVADKANRFIPNVEVHASWDYHCSPGLALKYEKVATVGKKGPQRWTVYAPFSLSSLGFYKKYIRGHDINAVDLTDFPAF